MSRRRHEQEVRTVRCAVHWPMLDSGSVLPEESELIWRHFHVMDI